MDVLRIYRDFGVNHLTEGHKHCSKNWVNTQCPHCTGNYGYHLGWNMVENYFRCRRCGWHPPVKTLSMILDLPIKDTIQTIKGYGVVKSFIDNTPRNKKEFVFPSHTTKLKKQHITYLKDRQFNPDKLKQEFGIKATGPISYIDNFDYRFRILIPFTWNGEIVTFDSRDITNLQQDKYKACPIDREIIARKDIVYGNQEYWGDSIICVEGPFDVWRFGAENAVAVSGIEYKSKQVREMANAFKKVIVVFDDELQAITQARKLVKDLQFRNVEAYIHKIKGDPGSMSQRDANKLVKKLLNK